MVSNFFAKAASIMAVKGWLALPISLFIFCGVFYCSTKSLLHRQKLTNHAVKIGPPIEMKRISFGYENLLSNTLWIRVIQDFDVCEVVQEKKDGLNYCRKYDWVFQMMNVIFSLEPRFIVPQRVGPLALSVLINDIAGASSLFWQAYLNFPDNWIISYRYGYHLLSEENNPKKASFFFRESARNNGPSWLNALSVTVIAQSTERKEQLEKIYQDFKAQNIDPAMLERIRKKIDSNAHKQNQAN